MRPRRSVLITAATLVAVLPIFGAAASHAAFGSTVTAQTTDAARHLVLIQRAGTHRDVDVAPAGQSQGDYQAFSDLLFKADHRIGTASGSCMDVEVTPNVSFALQCVVTLSLPAGQLATQGVLVFSGSSTANTLAVTGGTGSYRAVGGQLALSFLNNGDKKLVIDLVGND